MCMLREIRNIKKKRQLRRPIQLFTHGQWWSNVCKSTTDISTCTILQVNNYSSFKPANFIYFPHILRLHSIQNINQIPIITYSVLIFLNSNAPNWKYINTNTTLHTVTAQKVDSWKMQQGCTDPQTYNNTSYCPYTMNFPKFKFKSCNYKT